MNSTMEAHDPPHRPSKKRKRIMGELRDLERYRAGYPDCDKEYNMDPDKQNIRCRNLLFYKGFIPSQPDNATILEFHNKWFGDYRELEYQHGFIQWLFPIREQGLNPKAQKLYPHEMLVMRQDPQIQARILKSYSLILDFYGMRFADGSGKLERTKNFKPRYRNLNQSFHNNLRITRILKCLGEMNLERLKYPFLLFVVQEMFINNELRNCRQSCERYWIPTLRDSTERNVLLSIFKASNQQRRSYVNQLVEKWDVKHGLEPQITVKVFEMSEGGVDKLTSSFAKLGSYDESKEQWQITYEDNSTGYASPACIRRVNDILVESKQEEEEKEALQENMGKEANATPKSTVETKDNDEDAEMKSIDNTSTTAEVMEIEQNVKDTTGDSRNMDEQTPQGFVEAIPAEGKGNAVEANG